MGEWISQNQTDLLTGAREIAIRRERQEQKKAISVGQVAVCSPFNHAWSWLVVVKGYSEEPLMSLTNPRVDRHGAMRILEMYLTQWKCEASCRFIKRTYNLEDVMVFNYTALKNTVVLAQAVFYFVSAELGKKLKLNILLKKIYEKAKRFFEIPDFRQYAIADGIYRILFVSNTGFTPNLERKEAEGQLFLPFAVQLCQKFWGKSSRFLLDFYFLVL
jgi:hypothetical protein